MKLQSHTHGFVTLAASVLLLLILNFASAQTLTNLLSAQTSSSNRLDLGQFAGGTVLSVQLSGQIDLGDSWKTYADGSLAAAVTSTNYPYANAGASYPTNAGGDGLNHFPGGGANYDVRSFSFGLAGALTTDTTNPSAIRFGSVVATFSQTSTNRSDWFFIGRSNVVTIPSAGSHLFLAVSDPYYPNNSGSYAVTLTTLKAAPPQTHPALTVGTSPAGQFVSWPATATNFVLETSPTPGQSGSWQTVTTPPVVANGLCTVAIQSTQSCSFFRLRQTQP